MNGPRSPIYLSLAFAALLAAACGSDSDDDSVPDLPPDDSVPNGALPADDTSDGQSGAPDAGGTVEARAGAVFAGFLDVVDGYASAPVARPELTVETTPDLIFYQRFEDGRGVVTVPRWEDVGEERAVFEAWAEETGGAFDDRALFEELFGWFFVVHELGHHLQEESSRTLASRWDEELEANEIAVAYFGATDRARLDALVPALRAIRDSIEPPEGTDREYFDREYESLEGPTIYGFFQLGFVVDAYERIETLDLERIVREDLEL